MHDATALVQVLLLGDNRLTSIEAVGLSQLTNLRSLFLQNNLITHVEGLSCLTALEELVRSCMHCPQPLQRLLVQPSILCVRYALGQSVCLGPRQAGTDCRARPSMI